MMIFVSGWVFCCEVWFDIMQYIVYQYNNLYKLKL